MPWQETNGVYDLRFPTNGLLIMKSWGPLEEWHKERAFYQDGTFIQIEGSIAEKVIFFSDLGFNPDRGFLFFVGKKADRELLGKKF